LFDRNIGDLLDVSIFDRVLPVPVDSVVLMSTIRELLVDRWS